MATGQPQHRPHLFPRDTRSTEGYTAKPQARDPEPGVPEKDRPQHAGALRAQLAQVVIAQQPRVAELQAANVRSAIGIQVEFESEQNVALAAASLARERQGIELMNVRRQGNHVLATVFVPEGKLTHFEKLITEYANHRTDKNGNRLDHQTLVDAISALRVATFESVWTDTAEAMPTDDAEVIWWEAWLPLGRDVARTLGDFRTVAAVYIKRYLRKEHHGNC
jgi:hypothetical protein